MKTNFPKIKIVAFLILFSILFYSCMSKSAAPSNFDIGVGLYSFNKFSFKEAVEMAKAAQVKKVEGFSFHTLGEGFEGELIAGLSDRGISNLKNMLDSNQIQMVSMYVDGKTLKDWEILFQQGQKLGLKFLVGEPDPTILDEINDLAGKYKLPLAIHEHAKGLSHYWHPDSALAAIKDREHLKICADIGHWVRSGLDPVECLQKVEGKILSLHVKDLDAAGNLEANDVNIGTGVIDYDNVFAELKRQKFSGDIFIECEHDFDNNLKDVKESVNYIIQKSK